MSRKTHNTRTSRRYPAQGLVIYLAAWAAIGTLLLDLATHLVERIGLTLRIPAMVVILGLAASALLSFLYLMYRLFSLFMRWVSLLPRLLSASLPLASSALLLASVFVTFSIQPFTTQQPGALAYKPFVVLVADFPGPDPDKYAVTRSILSSLMSATAEDPEVHIVAFHQAITDEQGGDYLASAIGRQDKASIVIRGWYAATAARFLVTTHFLLLRSPSELGLIHSSTTTIAPLYQVNDFTLQINLSKQLTDLTLLTLGLIDYEQGNYSAAVSPLSQAAGDSTIAPMLEDRDVAYRYLGRAYYFLGDYQYAVEDSSRALSMDPTDASAVADRGLAFYQLGHRKSAYRDLNEAIAFAPHSAVVRDAYDTRGEILAARGEYRKAIEDYSEAIHLGLNCACVFSDRAYARDKVRDYRGAIADYSSAIKRDPRNFCYYIGLGSEWDELRRPQKAINDYEVALRLNARDDSAYYGIALAHYQMGDYRGAIHYDSMAIQLNARNVDAYQDRADAKYRSGDYAGAVRDYAALMRLRPWDAAASDGHGNALFMLAAYRGAIRDFTRAIRLDSTFADAFLWRGVAWSSIGEEGRARSDYHTAFHLYRTQSNSTGEGQAEKRLVGRRG